MIGRPQIRISDLGRPPACGCIRSPSPAASTTACSGDRFSSRIVGLVWGSRVIRQERFTIINVAGALRSMTSDKADSFAYRAAANDFVAVIEHGGLAGRNCALPPIELDERRSVV